ncbi:MAG: hypothetical protein WA876_06315 [Candidatus Acidiferrales bacterium]
MPEVTHEQVNLMLHLYELRREPTMREARSWFMANFHPKSAEDVMKICPPGSKENAYMRMVVSYWEMVTNIVSRGLIDEEFFFENSGEQWVVWEAVRPIAHEWRMIFKNPHAWEKLEEHCKRLEAWREKRAPGSTEAMRQMIARMAAKEPAIPPAAQQAARPA